MFFFGCLSVELQTYLCQWGKDDGCFSDSFPPELVGPPTVLISRSKQILHRWPQQMLQSPTEMAGQTRALQGKHIYRSWWWIYLHLSLRTLQAKRRSVVYLNLLDSLEQIHVFWNHHQPPPQHVAGQVNNSFFYDQALKKTHVSSFYDPRRRCAQWKTKNTGATPWFWEQRLGLFGHPCVLARFPGASVIPTPDRIMGAAKLVSMIVDV